MRAARHPGYRYKYLRYTRYHKLFRAAAKTFIRNYVKHRKTIKICGMDEWDSLSSFCLGPEAMV